MPFEKLEFTEFDIDQSQCLSRKTDGKQFTRVPLKTVESMSMVSMLFENENTCFVVPVGTIFNRPYPHLPDMVIDNHDLGYSVRTIISDVANIKCKNPNLNIDEFFLHRFIKDIEEAYRFIKDMKETYSFRGTEESQKIANKMITQFTLRPDKIHCTPSGKFKFSPDVPYEETHMDTESYRYVPPEDLRGDINASDWFEKKIVWGLGMILREFCCGKYPFQTSQSVFVELQHIVENRPIPIPEGLPYSPEMHTILNWCLEKDPVRRPSLKNIMELLNKTQLKCPKNVSYLQGKNRKICLVTLLCVKKANLYLPPEIWEIIFSTFLFPGDTMYTWFNSAKCSME